jgi:uncharacterized RDD family membrane protein YckC
MGAGVIDFVVAVAIVVAFVTAAHAVPSLAGTFTMLATVFSTLLYFVIAEHYYQATIGKRLFGLTVVTVDGERPELLAHVVRGMTRIPEMMMVVPYLFVVPFSQRRQRFGDMITETLVVRRADLERR